MPHTPNIRLSDGLKRHYNLISANKEDDIRLPFDLSDHPEWKDEAYQLTIYKESDRSTLVSTGFDSDEFTVTIPDYDFGTIKAVAVIEDRTDPGNIDAIDTIAYIIFKQFPGGVERTLEGHAEYEEEDGNIITIPYYSTGFITP